MPGGCGDRDPHNMDDLRLRKLLESKEDCIIRILTTR
jgi:hypothetical protein